VLLQSFVNDSSIDAFWRLDDRLRRQAWGSQLDLAAEEARYFRWC
jgi:hypothetical protein